MNRTPSAGAQRGGTFIGIIIGLLIGLGLALLVALYIAKVPVPFVEKVQHRTPEQDAAEIERNKNWDPNAPLAGKQAGKPVSEAA
ncbi:MAG: sporulation protein, partial [Burkholderiales bacterium]|nr:sporulation protein [Burkholderiales bacterium]